MKEFLENLEGVHLMHGEYTVCGDAFDIAKTEEDFEDGSLRETKKRVVTCARCAALIEYCRGVRTAASPERY